MGSEESGLTVKIEIDLDQLILGSAVNYMDKPRIHECKAIVMALQKQMPEEVDITERFRQQVKEYKKLTMWRTDER